MRSSAGIAAARDRSNVLFPEPVAPLTRTVRRRRTASTSRAAASPLSAPAATQDADPASGIESGRNFRIERHGPPTGSMTAFAREPSRIRASTKGCSMVSSRPTLAAMRYTRSDSSAASRKASATLSSRPSRSTKIRSGAFTRTSVTRGSSSSGCRQPNPKRSAQRRSSSASESTAPATVRTRSRMSRRRAGSAYRASSVAGSRPAATSLRTRATSALSITRVRG